MKRVTKNAHVFQSVYRQIYSTEIALLKMHNDITLKMDNGKVTGITLFNLFVFFIILFKLFMVRLSLWYGVSSLSIS